MIKSILLVGPVLGLCACASVNHETTYINPPAIHRLSDNKPALPVGITAKSVVSSAQEAEAIPTLEYYAAMNAARSENADSTVIARYVDAGVTLVNSYCLRWFQHLSEQDVKKSFNTENFNVIRALGTAFLGLGNANSVIVSAYGASNTAYESYSKNYSDAFLLAPNSRKVKAQVLNLLDSRADELLGIVKASDDPKTVTPVPKTFSEAYRRLERFADLCTHSTAKEIVNSALDQSNATATADGKVSLAPTSAAIAAKDADLTRKIATAESQSSKAKAATLAASQANAPLQNQLKTTQEALEDQKEATSRAIKEVKRLIEERDDMRRRLMALESEVSTLKQPATPPIDKKPD